MCLSKTLYPLLSTGPTQETFEHDFKIVDSVELSMKKSFLTLGQVMNEHHSDTRVYPSFNKFIYHYGRNHLFIMNV